MARPARFLFKPPTHAANAGPRLRIGNSLKDGGCNFCSRDTSVTGMREVTVLVVEQAPDRSGGSIRFCLSCASELARELNLTGVEG